MARGPLYLVADFHIETLARLLAHSVMPDVKTRTSGSDPVMAALAAGPPSAEWTAVVWTRPEAVAEQFQRAVRFEDADAGRALEETRAYAAAVARFARGTRATLVPSWILPPWHRGHGPLDLRPGIGVADLLARMNLALAEALAPQSNVFVLDTARWLSAVGPRAWSNKLWYASKSPFTAALLEHAAAEIAAAMDGIAGTARRLIVLDLDDVLWGGIVGEAGVDGLQLGGHDHVGEAFLDFQRALKALSRRGVQLAIASKNDEAAALDAIDRHPEMLLRRSDFAAWRINWNDKAENVAALLMDVGLGPESAVFIDDSPLERARVAGAVPGVLVPDWPADAARYCEALASLRCFDSPSITVEDRARTATYAAERTRKASLTSAASLDDWLASLDISVTVEPLTAATAERAAQLFNKTNQMNLATRRLPAADLMRWAAAPNRTMLTIRVADRFGDSGLTGIVGLEHHGPEARLTDFLLSCRVIGRQVEEALLHVAVAHARARGSAELVAEYRPTARNAPCLAFFERSGLRGSGDHRFVWHTAEIYACPRWITLRDETGVPSPGNT